VIREYGIARNVSRSPRTPGGPRCARGVATGATDATPGATSSSFSNGRSWLRYTSTNRCSPTEARPETRKSVREKSGDAQNSTSRRPGDRHPNAAGPSAVGQQPPTWSRAGG